MWKLETRTTCAVEAINGVLGRGMPGKSNSFNFVHFIQKFELARSMKLRNQYDRCAVKRKKIGSNEKSVLIRNASELLDTNVITVADFLEHIAKFKDNKCGKRDKCGSVLSDESDSESEPPTSQPTSQPASKRARTDSVNLCRVCDEKESNIILFPCSHAVICLECWTKKTLINYKYCVECFSEVKNVIRFN